MQHAIRHVINANRYAVCYRKIYCIFLSSFTLNNGSKYLVLDIFHHGKFHSGHVHSKIQLGTVELFSLSTKTTMLILILLFAGIYRCETYTCTGTQTQCFIMAVTFSTDLSLPSTVTLQVELASPSLLLITHVYSPLSSGKTSAKISFLTSPTLTNSNSSVE